MALDKSDRLNTVATLHAVFTIDVFCLGERCCVDTGHTPTPKQEIGYGHTLTLAPPTCGGPMTSSITPHTRV
jgi:hypothetical protein